MNTPSQPLNLVVAASCCGDPFLQGQGRWSELMGRLMKPNTGQAKDLGGGSSSRRATTINIQPELQRNGID